MNASAIMQHPHNLPIRMVRKRKIWINNGSLVDSQKPRTVVPPKAKVSWEAFVANIENSQPIDTYPRLAGTGVFVIDASCINGRPTDSIRDAYLHEVRGKVSADLYQTLENNVKSDVWAIANVIHSTLPV